jgi:hypothetical protein
VNHGGPPRRDFYPGGPSFREGQRGFAERDSLRWGDGFTIQQNVPAAVGPPVPFVSASRQLVHASLPRPVVWLAQANVDDGVQVPAGEAAPINVRFRITIGCGQSRTTFTFAIITLTAANGYQQPPGTQPAAFNFPAADVQIDALLSYTPTVGGALSVPVGAMVAPWAHMPFGERLEPWAHEGP